MACPPPHLVKLAGDEFSFSASQKLDRASGTGELPPHLCSSLQLAVISLSPATEGGDRSQHPSLPNPRHSDLTEVTTCLWPALGEDSL